MSVKSVATSTKKSSTVTHVYRGFAIHLRFPSEHVTQQWECRECCRHMLRIDLDEDFIRDVLLMQSPQHGLGILGIWCANEDDFLRFPHIKIQGREQAANAKRLLLHMPSYQIQHLLSPLQIVGFAGA